MDRKVNLISAMFSLLFERPLIPINFLCKKRLIIEFKGMIFRFIDDNMGFKIKIYSINS